MTENTHEFASPRAAIADAASAFDPPRRISVAESAAQTLMIDQPGGYSGPWSPEDTPYMVEPMNLLSSRRHEAVVFVGPARSGKTMALLDAWVCYAVTCDPGDMLVVQMTQEKAREYSKIRVDRMIRNSPALARMKSPSGQDDNTHDKLFRHGMWLKLGWPSASQLASSDYRYVALTDYDRMPDDVDGEGSVFALGLKRTTTFLSRGMCMVESSPGREILDPNWRGATEHDAPPSTGILALYNRGDRRRWYWTCPECANLFEAAPGLRLFKTLPPENELMELVRTADLAALAEEHAVVWCPHCGVRLGPELKHALNMSGRWLRDGERNGAPITSPVASFWLGGVAAAYQPWHSLILRYLQGLREYVMTGAEETLRATVNTDQAMPYLPRAMQEQTAQTHATERLPRFVVPDEARFLIAAVDVQGGRHGRFVVQVHAVGPHLEQWLVDRYELRTSPRGEHIGIDPGGYAEDWDVLTDRVIGSTYRMSDGRELRVHLTVVDTGGEAGTTANAYTWYRRIRQTHGQHVMLVKGESWKGDTPIRRARARDANGRAIRDVPLWLVNTDFFKDIVAANLRRKTAGPGFMHFPDWLAPSFFEELHAEMRGPTGKWRKIRARNEAFDCCVYVLAACWKLGANKIDWDRPPHWAKRLDAGNVGVMSAQERREIQRSTAETQKEPPLPPAKKPPRVRSPVASSDWLERL